MSEQARSAGERTESPGDEGSPDAADAGRRPPDVAEPAGRGPDRATPAGPDADEGGATAVDPPVPDDAETTSGSGDVQVRKPRGRQTVADMVRSMALVVGVVVVGVFATVTLGRDPVRDIDYASDLTAARTGAPYDIYAPVGLDDWRTTSVRFGPTEGATVWHLGFVSPTEEYVGLDQTDGSSAPFIAALTENATDIGSPVTIGAEQWTRYDGGGTDEDEVLRGLARVDDDVTVLVSGTADWAELEEFAAALSAE